MSLLRYTVPSLGAPITTRVQRLSSEAELRGLAAVAGIGLERLFPSDSCVCS